MMPVMSAVRTMDVFLSPEDDLVDERQSEVRHEYHAGYADAMAGASRTDHRIAGNIFIAQGSHLSGKKCEAFASDMKVHISQADEDWYYYPDVLVSCDRAVVKEYYCDTPSVIVEVLSPETEKIDRREKLRAYRSLPSVHNYILVDQMARELTVYHRISEGWETIVLADDATLHIPELEFSMTLDAVYARTELD